MKHTTIWMDGWMSCKNGVPRDRNPHIGAYAFEWFAGWDAAQAAKWAE